MKSAIIIVLLFVGVLFSWILHEITRKKQQTRNHILSKEIVVQIKNANDKPVNFDRLDKNSNLYNIEIKPDFSDYFQ